MADMVSKKSLAAARMHGRQCSRLSRGFTMIEAIGVVLIVAILLTVGFVAITQTQRSMAQLEVDKTARELYVAAQNHLSTVHSQRLLNVNAGTTDAKAKAIDKGLQLAAEAPDGIYYFVHPSDGYDINSSENALGLMLPFGSIDETVRRDGSYVIRYQPETGEVLDVFYAKTSGFGAHTFSVDEYATLKSGYTGQDKASARASYGNDGAVIGWYGGDAAGSEAIALKAPTVQVKNGDALQVEVTDPKANAERLTAYNANKADADKADLKLRLIVEGKTSGAAVYFDLTGGDTHVSVATGSDASTAGTKYIVKLDDVTESQGRFFHVTSASDRGTKIQNAAKAFVPGEDLKIYAWISSTGQTAAAKSPETTVNSLFANGSEAKSSGEYDYEAKIASIRHLSNLSYDVSHFNPKNGGENLYTNVAATQTTNLSWGDFKPAGKSADIRIFYGMAASASQEASAAGTFLPVNPQYKLAYEGENHWITGIKVNLSSDPTANTTGLTEDEKTNMRGAGLFASLATGSSVQNLELVDFDVASTVGRAGALAGTLNETAVSNILVRNSLNNSANAEDAFKVQGKDVAGGLVGVVDDSSEISNCAASVYVNASGGPAGGLVGTAGATTIQNSYAGGHTSNRDQLAQATGVGRYNVSASGAAGGLIGTSSGTVIKNCYSTASTLGSPSGGLIGSASGGSVENCYAVCKVFGEGTKGAFLGESSATLSGANRFVEIVNPGMSAIGNQGESSDVTYLYASTSDQTSYQVYNAMIDSDRSAVPYDGTIVSAYSGKYAFPTVSELAGIAENTAGVPLFLYVHYGDWPKVEIEAVNAK